MGQDEEQIGPLVRQWSERSQAAGVTDFVRGKIREIEAEFGIKVFFAVEHSSHVWGTSHADSDWDVKMVYCYEAQRYFSPGELHTAMKKVYGPRESTTIKGVDKAAGSNAGPKHVTDLDVEISGWDVLQFLKLVRSGDATVMEMLLCPMTYINDKALMAEVKSAMDHFCPPSKLARTNTTMAKAILSQIRDNKGKFANMKPGTKQTKSFGYILRNLLSAHVLLSCKTTSQAHLSWCDLCDALEAMTAEALPASADVSELELFSLDVDQFRSFFSRFGQGSLDDPALLIAPDELAATVKVAWEALESAERRLARCAGKEAGKGGGRGAEAEADRAWEELLGGWAARLLHALHPPPPPDSEQPLPAPGGGVRAQAQEARVTAASAGRGSSLGRVGGGRGEMVWCTLGGVAVGVGLGLLLGRGSGARGLR